MKPHCPFYVETVNDRWHTQEEDHRKQEKKFWRRSICLTLGAAVAAALAAAFTGLGWRATSTQLALAYPPKFRFVNFELMDHNGKPITTLQSNQMFRVHGELFETGRGPAKIVETKCQTYFTGPHLPMKRPYTEKDAPSCLIINPSDSLRKTDFIPGQFAYFEVKGVVPDRTSDNTLYVFGELTFEDKNIGTRFSLFARRYDPGERRFVKVSNDDYEREDEQALDQKAP